MILLTSFHSLTSPSWLVFTTLTLHFTHLSHSLKLSISLKIHFCFILCFSVKLSVMRCILYFAFFSAFVNKFELTHWGFTGDLQATTAKCGCVLQLWMALCSVSVRHKERVNNSVLRHVVLSWLMSTGLNLPGTSFEVGYSGKAGWRSAGTRGSGCLGQKWRCYNPQLCWKRLSLSCLRSDSLFLGGTVALSRTGSSSCCRLYLCCYHRLALMWWWCVLHMHVMLASRVTTNMVKFQVGMLVVESEDDCYL